MYTAFIPGMPGYMEVLLILFVVLLLFGAKRLPELSRALGRSLGEFKKGRAEGEKEPARLDSDQEAKKESEAGKEDGRQA